MSHGEHHLHIPHVFRELVHPHSGKTVHVARSPTEARELKKSLTRQERHDIDVFLHGSDQHIEFLQSLEEHHQSQRALLRDRHGDAYHEVEHVLQASANLSKELEYARNQGVNLEMNFNKYGYDSHLRTHNGSGVQSSASSLSGEGKASKSDWIAQRSQGRSMSLFVKPILRQYHHNGLLWRSQEPEETASYELFLDLVYVGIIAISGDSAAAAATGKSLLRFLVTIVMSYKIWFDLGNIIGWFDADDIGRRLFVMFILICLLGFTTNMTEYFNETFAPLVAFYVTARLALILYMLSVAYALPSVRYFLCLNSMLMLVPLGIWIASIHVEEPLRNIPIWIAIVMETFGSGLLVGLFYRVKMSGPGHWLRKKFEYIPATNIEHRTERISSFVILVLGYSVVSLLYQSRNHIGINPFFGKAVLGLMQAFAIGSIYHEMDSFNLHSHAIRRHPATAFVWHTFHLPLIFSYILAGAALSRLVLATDVPGANIDDLAPESAVLSMPTISSGLRWFYCAGVGIALFSTCPIALGHDYRTPPNMDCPFTRERRLVVRLLISLAITFLGFAKSLDSLKIISITCGLVHLALFVELFGNTLSGHCHAAERKKCHYTVKRRDMRKSVTTLDSEESTDTQDIKDGNLEKSDMKEEVTTIT
ncbi:MAG: hypothetical protein M1828_004185 [Chrysothrix sp. TS-e1954]|nr:MAG: hypothetical protein M1828_004185 [Chrysothrix sp. TS-e1954]